MKDIPDYGDHMPLEDFVECCKDGMFIDYDGWGHYASEKKMSTKIIRPSNVTDGTYKKNFSHVVWFNK